MPSSSSRIILSRFFNNNVKLVANMCTKCYEESEDVKIVSVNINFLKQMDNFKYLVDIFDFLTDDGTIVESENKEGEFGFAIDESELSLKYTETFNELIKTNKEAISIIEENFSRAPRGHLDVKNSTDVFKGFSTDDMKNSTKHRTKIIKACGQIRRKVYQRISTRIFKNIRKSRVSKSSLHKKKCKRKYIKTEATTINENYCESDSIEHSKYFPISFENNNVITKEDHLKLENIKVEIKCEHCKIGHCTCPANCLSKLRLELDITDYESRYFKTLESQEASFTSKSKTCLKKDGFENKVIYEKTPIFVPLKSPHNLIEECLYHDPWALLVATIFLNRTSCMCARPYVFWFLKENPDPFVVLDKYPKELEKYFVNLGLQKTRAVQIWRMSHDFVYKKWDSVKELYGIGRYGEDAFRMFCLGDFSVEPKDRFLKIYKAWYEKVAMKEGLV